MGWLSFLGKTRRQGARADPAGAADDFEAVRALAMLWAERGDIGQAEHFCRRALELDPASIEMHAHLGNILRAAGRLEEALACCERVRDLAPDNGAARNNLGNALKDVGRLDEAMAEYRAAVALDPELPQAHFNLGTGLHESGQPEEAEACYRAMLRYAPDYADCWLHLAGVLDEQGRPAEAAEAFARVLALAPEDPAVHVNYALHLLARGDYANGWREYAARWDLPGSARLPGPQWDGSDLSGRTILVYGEQGFGDVIQFFRYLGLLRARGARVVFRCSRKLQALFANAPEVAAVLADGDPLPAFDVCCPLLDLPRILGTTLATIPAHVPYIRAPEGRGRWWGDRLAKRPGSLKVGLFWSTDTETRGGRKRRLHLDMFAPLVGAGKVEFYSLQRGEPARQALTPPAGMSLVDATRDLQDFADDAALMAHLDLIISIDTATAHLAGALAKPVWVLLPANPDWRFGQQGEGMPWYPTMRLFRQRKGEPWERVIERMAAALAQLAAPA